MEGNSLTKVVMEYLGVKTNLNENQDKESKT